MAGQNWSVFRAAVPGGSSEFVFVGPGVREQRLKTMRHTLFQRYCQSIVIAVGSVRNLIDRAVLSIGARRGVNRRRKGTGRISVRVLYGVSVIGCRRGVQIGNSIKVDAAAPDLGGG